MMQKTIPQNIEAEEAVLGSILIDPRAYFDVAQVVKPEQFYLQKHRWIFEAIAALRDNSEPVDFLTLTTELEKRDQLEQVGGAAFVSQLVNVVPSAVNVQKYARMVRDAYTRRRIIEAAADAAKAAYNEELGTGAVLDRVETSFFRIRNDARTSDGPRSMNAIAESVYTEFEDVYSGKTSPGFTTGYTDIDAKLHGWRDANLYILAARPGMGKTSLMLNFAEYAHRNKKRVLMFSLEMSCAQVFERMLIARGMSNAEINNRRLSDDRWPVFSENVGELGEMTIWVDDTPAISVQDLRARAMRMSLEHGVDMVIVDYLQLMRGGQRFSRHDLEVGYISSSLKALAKELNCPVIAAAQLNRQLEYRVEKRPTLSDLRGSGSIEQDADAVVFINRDAEWQPTPTNKIQKCALIVAKNRYGATGDIAIGWNPERYMFVPTARGGTR